METFDWCIISRWLGDTLLYTVIVIANYWGVLLDPQFCGRVFTATGQDTGL